MFSGDGGCYRGGMSEERAPARRLRDLNPVVADGLLAAVLALLAFSQLLIQPSIYRRLGIWLLHEPAGT
jgi:hypothetical protein